MQIAIAITTAHVNEAQKICNILCIFWNVLLVKVEEDQLDRSSEKWSIM
jgi:hypothetical protein